LGAVYRARDPKLNRDVALKVLSDPVVSDPRMACDRRAACELHEDVYAAVTSLTMN
jgi:hypothetical protein